MNDMYARETPEPDDALNPHASAPFIEPPAWQDELDMAVSPAEASWAVDAARAAGALTQAEPEAG